MNIVKAILHLNAFLPNGDFPGSYPGGEKTEWTEDEWNAFEDYPGKPTWEELESADEQAEKEQQKELAIRNLRHEYNRKITKAYGADDIFDEIQKRLGGRATSEQDTERDRLRNEFQTKKSELLDK